ncbi:hypothetical protein ATE84_3050 [Aquimarina sp. MAR_2010_214]|nr:hypothetical protein ATE84_3050 [Aquimarina sp. MAR_2010_214]
MYLLVIILMIFRDWFDSYFMNFSLFRFNNQIDFIINITHDSKNTNNYRAK